MVALQSASKLFSREKTWKVRQRQAQASNTDHRPIVIVLTLSNFFKRKFWVRFPVFFRTFVVVPSVSRSCQLREANRAQKLHMDNWWVLCSCQICSVKLTRWNDETKQTWSNHEQSSACLIFTGVLLDAPHATACCSWKSLKCAALRYSKFHEVKNESLATATWRQSSEWRSLGAQWASSSPVVRFLSIGIAWPLIWRYTSI